MENMDFTQEEIEEFENEGFKDALEEGTKNTKNDVIAKVAIGIGVFIACNVIAGICKPKLKAIMAKKRGKEIKDAITKNLDPTDDELQDDVIDMTNEHNDNEEESN